ncbi:6787_t:CDS:1 [Ambispora gerdemannii]|uniref:6787_t:CDS:1 n=1 Tax=Ambispora gerdemannii TaxID=144530 RepID=A0A9N9FTA0_9GLOM|nr:6787_t:CDS:1 [Ambispora gerdemannii]
MSTNNIKEKNAIHEFPNYENAVKAFFSDIEMQKRTYNNTGEAINKFLKTTRSDAPEMIEYLTANHQNPQNHVILGAIYMYKVLCNRRPKSFDEYRKAAECNDPHGQYLLGCYYVAGIGTNQSSEMAVYWQRQAANQRIPSAHFALGYHYQYGYGVKKNLLNFYYYLQKAAESGHIRAMRKLANAHNCGAGTLQDNHKAIYWATKYKKAASDDYANTFMKNLFDPDLHRQKKMYFGMWCYW